MAEEVPTTPGEGLISNICVPDRTDVDISALTCADVFEQLSSKERLYAHYLCKAAWLGAEITQRQVSPESPGIIEFILELYHSCSGHWSNLLDSPPGSESHHRLSHALTYFAFVLYNMGNYYGYGDTKFVPSVPQNFIQELAAKSSEKARNLLSQCLVAMYSPQPSRLGYRSDHRQSAYYLDDENIMSEDEIKGVNDLMESKGIGHENTRLRCRYENGLPTFDILQASVEENVVPQNIGQLNSGAKVQLIKGSFSQQLRAICSLLTQAMGHAASEQQKEMLREYICHFETGNITHFKEAQKLWLKDADPNVELIIGFVEKYRDPSAARAEFEGVVALKSPLASEALSELSSRSLEFIRMLPWAGGDLLDDLGPFESSNLEPPDFNARHALAYSSTVIFTGINLPNFADIRDSYGCKNLLIINRNSPPNLDKVDYTKVTPWIAKEEAPDYIKHAHYSYMLRITIHELLGHGTGNKLLRQNQNGHHDVSNFDPQKPPIDPTTGHPIHTWYKDQETDRTVFGNLTATLNECRADGIGLYLLSENAILSIFDYIGGQSKFEADNLIYSGYLGITVAGLNGLLSYNPNSEEWSQAHERGYFIIMRALLTQPEFLRLEFDKNARRLTIRMDKAKTLSHGRKALELLVLRLHIWRVTANLHAFREYLRTAAAVDDYWLDIRALVKERSRGSWMFVQANTFISANGQDVFIKEYDTTPEGIIESWADRVAAKPY